MTSLTPEWLWLLPILLAALAWRRRRAWRHAPLPELLRLGAIALLVFALSDPRPPSAEGPGQVHVYLVDASDSVLAAEGRDREASLDRLARRVAESAGPDESRARLLVVFAANAVVAGPVRRETRAEWLTRLPALLRGASPEPGATDLEGGLRAALAAIPPEDRGEIVVFTDGRATKGDARLAVEEARRRGVRVSVAATDEAPPDAMIRSVSAPMEAGEEETIPIEIVSAATSAMKARLAVRRGGKAVWSEEVELDAGVEDTRRIMLPAEGLEPGVYEAEIASLAGPDAAPANNIWPFAIARRGVLAVAVLGNSRAAVADTLAKTDALRVMPGGSWSEVPIADVVVLSDASLAGVPREAVEGLAGRVLSGAAGLVVFGGPHTYAFGGYVDSPIDRLLPVSPTPATDLALGILLDCSGSMNEPAEDGRAKIVSAKEAVRDAVLTLGPGDRVALTGFAGGPQEILALQPRPARERLDAALGAVNAGGPTRLAGPLRTMRDTLNGATAARKHLVVVSDGQSADTLDELRNAVGALAGASVTTTVLAVGPKIDEERLRIVSFGDRSRLRRLRDYRNLAAALQEDLAEARDLVKTGRVKPETVAAVGAVSGIAQWPEMERFHRTTLRSTGRLLIRSPEGDPLAADGPAGLGRCLAVTWALDPVWTPGLGTWTEARRFLQQSVASVSPTRPSADVRLSASFVGDVLRVRCALKRDPARLEAPDLGYEVGRAGETVAKGAMTPDGPDSAAVDISGLPTGLLTVIVRPSERSGMTWTATRSVPRPYSYEWAALGPDRPALAALETGGAMADATAGPKPGRDMRPWLAGLALAAVLAALSIEAMRRRRERALTQVQSA